MKRIIAILLTLIMLLSAIFGASAFYETEIEPLNQNIPNPHNLNWFGAWVELNSYLSRANAILFDNRHTPSSLSALQIATDAAQKVFDFYDEVPTLAQIQEQIVLLQAAIDGLVRMAYKGHLDFWLAHARAIERGDYALASWNALQTAITSAQEILDNPNATQVQVDEQVSALEYAIGGLFVVYKGHLAFWIALASAIERGYFTSVTWNTLQTAITSAQAVMDDENATQTQINQRIISLENAVNGLVWSPPVVISVTGVTISGAATHNMNIGQVLQLSATVLPSNATNQGVTWRSSNTNVATVNANGRVTAVQAGTVTITVTTVDGNRTASVTVTVRAPVPPPPTIFSTDWEATPLNWLLFFLGFGWVWMWF